MGGFCEKFLPSDRWQWSDVSGLQHRPLDGVALPSRHWEWESDWYVDENFGGEPTEKGVGESGSHCGSLVGKGCCGLDPSPRAVPSAPALPAPCLSPLAARGRWLWALRAVPLSPCLSCTLLPTCLGSVLPQEPYRAPPPPHPPLPCGISGVDICHRLPRHLHERQEVEFLRAAAPVDSV